jgi:hypothetical protein
LFSQTDADIVEPDGPYDRIFRNSAFDISVSGLGTNDIGIDINLTIAASPHSGITSTHLEYIVGRIEAVWNTTLSSDGVGIRSSTQLTIVDAGLFGDAGDIVVEGIVSGRSNAELGGRVYQHNYHFNYTPGNVNPNSRFDTPAHEFGHLLGLSHRRNATGSIMSYVTRRRVTFEDLKRIADAYGH